MSMRSVAFIAICSSVVLATRCNAETQDFDEPPQDLRIMTWNVEWMYDDYLGDNRSKVAQEQSSPSTAYWQNKLQGVARVIAESQANIVALQEIEGKGTLRDIVSEIRKSTGISYRYAFIEGTDSYLEQDVGFLFRNGLLTFRRQEQTKAMFDSERYYNLSKHLIAEFRWKGVERPLTLMNVHLRARAEKEDIRVRQARLARYWLEQPLRQGHDVVLLGDLNSERSAGERRGDIGELLGGDGEAGMVDLIALLPDSTASTHLVLDKQFDRIVVSQSLLENEQGLDWVFEMVEVMDEAVIRGAPDGAEHWDNRLTMDLDELDLSDHFPVIASFRLK